MDQPDTVNFEELTGKCPLCGTGEYKSFRQYESAVLARCPVCRLVYVRFADTDQLPDQSGKHLKGQRYNDPDRFWRRIRKASWQIRQTMSKRHGERECLVDIGAAAGHTLIAAKGLGLNAIGIDVSRDAVATCKAKALQARQGSMTDTGLPDASCTYVILKHVLEHELDLSASLGEMNRIARPAIIGRHGCTGTGWTSSIMAISSILPRRPWPKRCAAMDGLSGSMERTAGTR